MHKYFLLFLMLCVLHSFGQGEKTTDSNLYNFKNSNAFANYLLNNQDYENAILELTRLNFLNPSDDSVKFNLLYAYRQAGQLDQAQAFYSRLFPTKASAEVPKAFFYEYYKTLLLTRQFETAYTITLSYPRLTAEERANQKLATLLLQAKWDEALKQSEADAVNDQLLLSYAREGAALEYKSPALAASLSTLVPGLGKIYSGRTADGILAFIFVGANAYAAYRGFSSNGISSGYGWLFASLGTAYYISNIYGSYQAATFYNEHLNEHLQTKVQQHLFTEL
jgi:TM2 domain-containing membrane protein YozV